MTTKKQLEKMIESLEKRKDEYWHQVIDLKKETEKLKGDIGKFQNEKENIDFAYKKLKSLVQTIVKILAGDSEPKSKSEVITDLLTNKVNEAKEILKQVKEQSRDPYRQRFHDEYGDFN